VSISKIQTERVFEETSKILFSKGEKPRLVDILTEVSRFFAKNPAGQPLKLPLEYFGDGLRSNVDKANELFTNSQINLDILYEVCREHLNESMTLSTILRAYLERLRVRRVAIETLIDDYMFSIYNTDGYYLSVSDQFNDLDYTDISMTTAFVDTTTGSVTLPTVSNMTKKMAAGRVTSTSFKATVAGKEVRAEVISPFTGALDGLTNTAWSVEVETSEPVEVIGEIAIQLGTAQEPVTVSRLEFDPFGVTPVQVFVEATKASSNTRFDFGDQIKTSANKMVFVHPANEVHRMFITLRKTAPDYTRTQNNTIKYRYIFGAKEISITEHVYDNNAIWVSQPLYIPEELVDDNVIDAVSLVVQESVPADTSIKYYVAADVEEEEPEVSDFNWRSIDPISNGITNNENTVIRFDGALSFSKFIRTPDEGELDGSYLPLIPLDATNNDLRLRNPSPSVFQGVDEAYRIAAFNEDVLKESLVLEEGVNTTRIMHVALDAEALETGLSFWTNYINGTATASTAYGTIDSGNEFFWGGDVGMAGRSVYVETYLDSAEEQDLLLKEFRKADSNSQQWDVKVFLNGREIGDLPQGTDNLVLPWKFNEGLNHVCLMINIPANTGEFPYTHNGTLDLMSTSDLYDFGSVKLANWKYIDPFHMEFNETGQPKTFTIVNGEIVSRRKPTDNFRLRYAKATNSAPGAVRLKAEFGRSILNPNVTPTLDSYRLRFLYGEND